MKLNHEGKNATVRDGFVFVKSAHPHTSRSLSLFMSTKEYMKKWRAEHAEELRLKAAAGYQANKEERRRKAREHYHALPEETRIARQKAKKRVHNDKRKAYNASYFQSHKAEHNAYKVAWREHNPEATKSSGRKSMLKQRVIRKAKVMTHYGGKCVCCGEAGVDFLTIDHTHGGGNAHRESIGLGRSAGDHFISG